MKMRELEERTGVHRETIRVYLRYELVPPPSRPRKTTADYGEEHVKAIMAVRRLQQDSRLTLPQIKALMNGDANEKRVSANVFSHLEQIVAARVGLDDHLVSLDALAIRYKHARKDARALAAFDAIGIIPDEAGDAELLSIWGEMRNEGFLEDLDFSPKMLDFYVEAARFVGGWEARTFLDRTEGRIDEEAAAMMIERALPLMLNFFGLLRRKEFLKAIRTGGAAERTLTPPGVAPATSSERPSRSGRHAGPRSPG
jgi:DNA-binding transcriptional MerR regulator